MEKKKKTIKTETREKEKMRKAGHAWRGTL